ncbi:MAG: transposase [Actinobacteria bacterium]|nr:transposase [Actinomycetota bacterium]
MPKVILGVDPHKRLNAVVVLNMRGVVLARRSFTNTTEGFRELRTFSRRWRPRRWAIEGCNGVGKHLAQRLVAAGEEVVDVSTRRAALVRVFAEGNGRKNDDVDAHSIALVALHTPDLPVVHADDRAVTLRLLSQRRQELVDLRTQCVCRLHRDLVALLAGGAPKRLSAKAAKRLLATIKPRDEVGRLRRRLAAQKLVELVALDTKIAAADAELWRVMEAGGGADAFLDEHAMIVMADHSHSHVERTIDLNGPFADRRVLPPSGAGARHAEIALCPAQRSAMIYVLTESGESAVPRVVSTARAIEGVDLVMWWEAERVRIGGERGELSFAPGDEIADLRGRRWSIDGELDTLLAHVEDGVLHCEHYPDALARVWAAMSCPTSGDVLLSAEPAYEFPDWGNRAHVRGGSHGSLHRLDSLGALLFCGVDVPAGREDGNWSIADIAPMVVGHFGAA